MRLSFGPNDRTPQISEQRRTRMSRVRCWLLHTGVMIAACVVGLATFKLPAQEAEWIWSSSQAQGRIPEGACHFRKVFTVRNPEAGEIIIAADDNYELYLNNRRLGTGRGTEHLDKYDISEYLSRGRNVIAVKVENEDGGTAALVARVQVKERGGEWVSHSSDATWRTNLRPLPLWTLPVYNDRGWAMAHAFGPLGTTAPWDREEDQEVQGQTEHRRFQIAREFEVKRLLEDEQTGSLIAMSFNEFGQIIASQEGGPLLLIDFSESDNDEEGPRVLTYCDLVTNCQGILPLNGDVYVTGVGPDGLAVYRLSDGDRNGTLETAEALCHFDGDPGEHGPHGLTLGPDGMIYVTVGNHSSVRGGYSEDSPHRNFYEGDTVSPRYEDPGGHAAGVKVPGGAVVRLSLDGEKVELLAGGIRNAYDLCFDRIGRLFIHDSDMESDLGTSWYRPTRVYHVVPGADYGWRSGWSKFPGYYIDNLPGVTDTGRGSPTGCVVYNHVMFPTRYHDALFLGDWSEGRILVVRPKQQGATVIGDSEVFLQGQPLNVTDLTVGPDGSLYFCTGGRGTSGGIYRIAWLGNVPDAIKNIPEDLAGVIRQPQFHSAWARQRIAGIKQEIGGQWGNQLRGVALSAENPPFYRTRAIDLLQLFGPQPDVTLLKRLAEAQNEEVRAKAAALLGMHPGDDSESTLVSLLSDDDRSVRRIACESLSRIGATPSYEDLQRMLISDDRFECWAARRLLEQIPVEEWRDEVLTTDNHRLFVQGSLALIIVDPSKQNAYSVLARISENMRGFVSDRNFIDMLRITQLALVRGDVNPADIPAFCEDLSEEFPAGHEVMNRELARILAYLDVADIGDRYVDYLKSPSVSEVDKVHLGMYMPFIEADWTSEQRLDIIDYLERARVQEGGGSYEHYVMKACRDFARNVQEEDVDRILENAERWPNAALIAFYLLPAQLSDDRIDEIVRIDELIQEMDDDSYNQLKIAIIAVLARSGQQEAFEYLQAIWHRDPERRSMVAMGLAQKPDGDNWHLLVSSFQNLDERSGPDVLKALLEVAQRPSEPEYYRQLILLGLRLEQQGAGETNQLLEYWTGEQFELEGDGWETTLASWQDWFNREYPDQQPAELPVVDEESTWQFDELMEYLSSDDAREADPLRGQEIFAKANCATCHRFEDIGDNIGPDLTAVANRFTRREILESILYPSHVISDQYASKNVLTLAGRQHAGLLAQTSAGDYVVIDSEGKRTTIPADEIDLIEPSYVSSMPNGLLNELTIEEIADLFSYLGAGRRPRVAQEPASVRR